MTILMIIKKYIIQVRFRAKILKVISTQCQEKLYFESIRLIDDACLCIITEKKIKKKKKRLHNSLSIQEPFIISLISKKKVLLFH